MKVTRILQAETPTGIEDVLKPMAYIRADIWRRFGLLGTFGKSVSIIRKEITSGGWYADLPVDATLRAETTKDVVNDIFTYKEAAKDKVRKAIAARTTDKAERRRLYRLLKRDEWLSDPYLRRLMRKHFGHGICRAKNQFVVRADRFTTAIEQGMLVISIKIARKFGEDLKLVTTSSGKNVDLGDSNLRIIVKETHTEIHYCLEKGAGKPHGDQALGIDKGYMEAFTDSDGQAHGLAFGRVLSAYSDRIAATGKQRNKLHGLQKKHRAKGNNAEADRIRIHNLGRKKLEARKEKTRQQLRTIAYQSAHSIVDKAALVVCENLTSPIGKKHQWKRYNRRMSAWAKGVLAEALGNVCKQREAEHALVNGAYTSQMDSTTGLLNGKRVGDKFYCESGGVLQADVNAARNVLARLSDPDVTRFMPYLEVRQVLLKRSSGATERQGA